MRFERSTVRLDPWTIREFRGGKGVPILLLHGLSGSFEWWERNAEALAERHLVAGIDLLGFGSERRFVGSPLPLGFEDSTALLRQWVERRVGEPVHLVGHSMGGQLAIHFAATHPELIRSLTLVSSSGIPVDLRPGPHLRAMFHPPGTLLSFLPTLARDAFRAGPTSIALALARLLRDDVRPLLKRLVMPTLLVWGEDDPLVPLRYGEQFDDAIPHSRLEVLPGAGHIPMWDRPERFNELLLSHVTSVERGDATVEQPPRFRWAIQGCDRGICHRSSGQRNEIVLLHGLGIRSGYFRGLAGALYDRGLDSIAPDLPMFGYSQAVDPRSYEESVDAVITWADGLGLKDRVWVGHSTGAQVVHRIMLARPDLVRRAVFVSPIWNQEPLSTLWLAQGIVRDAPKESPHLVLIAMQAYWEAGMIRFFRAFRWYARDAGTVEQLPARSLIVHGEDDPMMHREYLGTLGAEIRVVPGAHGVVFTHPNQLGDVIANTP